MRDVNWDEVQELQDGQEFDRPGPGGYIVKITAVEDREDKEGLLIEYDIARGDYTGYAADTYERAGFWPLKMWVSYKEKALRFFKGFKTCVELSNPNYKFDTRNVQGLVGRWLGVVLGEEEYRANSGEIKTRLYTAQKRTGQAITQGDFKIPEMKRLTGSNSQTTQGGFTELTDDDGELPF